MDNILADLRSLLLTFYTVTALVATRIRCEMLDSSDGRRDAVILELPYGRQQNLLSGEGIVNANIVVRSRSVDQTKASDIAKVIFQALDGVTGAAGDSVVIQCERTEISTVQFDDEDSDNAGMHETQQLFSMWFQTQ